MAIITQNINFNNVIAGTGDGSTLPATISRVDNTRIFYMTTLNDSLELRGPITVEGDDIVLYLGIFFVGQDDAVIRLTNSNIFYTSQNDGTLRSTNGTVDLTGSRLVWQAFDTTPEPVTFTGTHSLLGRPPGGDTNAVNLILDNAVVRNNFVGSAGSQALINLNPTANGSFSGVGLEYQGATQNVPQANPYVGVSIGNGNRSNYTFRTTDAPIDATASNSLYHLIANCDFSLANTLSMREDTRAVFLNTTYAAGAGTSFAGYGFHGNAPDHVNCKGYSWNPSSNATDIRIDVKTGLLSRFRTAATSYDYDTLVGVGNDSLFPPNQAAPSVLTPGTAYLYLGDVVAGAESVQPPVPELLIQSYTNDVSSQTGMVPTDMSGAYEFNTTDAHDGALLPWVTTIPATSAQDRPNSSWDGIAETIRAEYYLEDTLYTHVVADGVFTLTGGLALTSATSSISGTTTSVGSNANPAAATNFSRIVVTGGIDLPSVFTLNQTLTGTIEMSDGDQLTIPVGLDVSGVTIQAPSSGSADIHSAHLASDFASFPASGVNLIPFPFISTISLPQQNGNYIIRNGNADATLVTGTAVGTTSDSSATSVTISDASYTNPNDIVIYWAGAGFGEIAQTFTGMDVTLLANADPNLSEGDITVAGTSFTTTLADGVTTVSAITTAGAFPASDTNRYWNQIKGEANYVRSLIAYHATSPRPVIPLIRLVSSEDVAINANFIKMVSGSNPVRIERFTNITFSGGSTIDDFTTSTTLQGLQAGIAAEGSYTSTKFAADVVSNNLATDGSVSAIVDEELRSGSLTNIGRS